MRFLLLRLTSLFFMLLAIVVFGYSAYVYLAIDMNAENIIRVVGLDEGWNSVVDLFAFRELVNGTIISICLFAVGLLSSVLISIEANTRDTADLLARIAARPEPSPLDDRSWQKPPMPQSTLKPRERVPVDDRARKYHT